MQDVEIIFETQSKIRVSCEREISFQIKEHFSFFAEGFRFHPMYKDKVWDGKIKLFNKGILPRGLLPELITFCEENNFTYSVDKKLSIKENVNIDLQTYINPSHKDGKPLEFYEYQLKGVQHALEQKQTILLSPTSTGKSLMIYSVVKYILENSDKKILIVVPTVNLVNQLYSDFEEYSLINGFDTEKYTHKIFQGQDKNSNKRVFLSTYHSISKLKKTYFEQFGCLIGDEVHKFKGKELQKINENCENAIYKIGLTGTLGNIEANKWTIQGLFGSPLVLTTNKEMIDLGRSANLKISMLQLIYSDDEKKLISQKTRIKNKALFSDEIDFVCHHSRRTRFVAAMALKQPLNTIILFNREEHGDFIYKTIVEMNPNKKVYFINGKKAIIDGKVFTGQAAIKIREQIRKQIDEDESSILVASFGTTGTGISIKNLNTMIIAASAKDEKKVLQAVGRILRVGKYPDVKIYDIGDDLSWKKNINHVLKHFVERVNYYKKEQFNFSIKKVYLYGDKTN